MKKLLTILGAVGLTASTGASVIACGNPDSKSPLANLSLEELNAKLKEHISEMKEFIKDHEGDESPEAKLEINRLIFEVYSFMADVFLDTDYLVDGIEGGRNAANPDDILVKTQDNEIEYNITCYILIVGLKDLNEHRFKDNEDYVKTFTSYIEKLTTKLAEKNDLSNLTLPDLNSKVELFKEIITKLVDEWDENSNTNRYARVCSEFYMFEAKVFLETDYAFTFGENGRLEETAIIKAKDDTDYQALLQETFDSLKHALDNPNDYEGPINQDYEEILQYYLSQLKDKLEHLGND